MQTPNNQPIYDISLAQFESGDYDDTELDSFVDEKTINELNSNLPPDEINVY